MAQMNTQEGRQLTAQQLALESEVELDQLERLVEAGVLKPVDGSFGWTDVWRVRTMRSLEAAGVPLEKMAPHFYTGRLSLDFLEDMLPPPAPRTGRTFGEFVESLGERGQLAGSVYEMLGLARPLDDTQTRVDEEEVVCEILELWSDDPEVMKRAARVAGYAIRMIVESWTGLHYELFRGLGGGARESWSEALHEREAENASRSIRLAERLPRWLTVRHYEQVLYNDIIENIEMQIDPFEERHTDLQGVRQPAVVFIDLSGFTAMTEADGDRAASAVTARFEESVSVASLRHGGRVVKLLGDGALLLFSEPVPAVRATLEVFDDLTDLMLRPHAGIDCGPIAERDGDVFGRTVNMASRLASAASEGQIVVSASVARAAQASGMATRELEPLSLKGVERAVLAFTVGTREPDTA